MTPENVLRIVLEKLEDKGIDYMITGSFASNLHGVPRTTLDADIVILASIEQLENFAKDIEKDFYIDLDTVREAVQKKGMFNIVHYESGFKVDFIVRKEDEYHIEEFQRRRKYKLGEKEYFFASVEDTIFAKLLWAKMGDSERQFKDALNIAKVQRERLDYGYLKKWAKFLGLENMLEKILREIGNK